MILGTGRRRLRVLRPGWRSSPASGRCRLWRGRRRRRVPPLVGPHCCCRWLLLLLLLCRWLRLHSPVPSLPYHDSLAIHLDNCNNRGRERSSPKPFRSSLFRSSLFPLPLFPFPASPLPFAAIPPLLLHRPGCCCCCCCCTAVMPGAPSIAGPRFAAGVGGPAIGVAPYASGV
jgi:hypothetical protein